MNIQGYRRRRPPLTVGITILHPDEIEDSIESSGNILRIQARIFIRKYASNEKAMAFIVGTSRYSSAIKNSKGEKLLWISTATDIHEQKTKEQKKDEFISIASHEMKTPLTTAKAYLQLLEISLAKEDEKANLYTKKAIHSIDRLRDLIC